MKIFLNPEKEQLTEILKRPVIDSKGLFEKAKVILDAVKILGDQAVLECTEKFDGVKLVNYKVTPEEIAESEHHIKPDLKLALDTARANIEKFHVSQKEEVKFIETMHGVECWRRSVAIQKVGLYIPGGTAPLFSTVLMLGIPAKIAGCEDVVLCTPPDKTGKIHPAILYTAKLVGIHQIFKVGGVQAIGAMAYGTETVPKTDKIFGPGNQYVTAAKQLVGIDSVAIDMPAGPSEVMVVADETTEIEFVAADLLSQAEHGVDSQSILVTFKEEYAKRVIAEVNRQAELLPRKEYILKSLENSKIIVVNEKQEALQVINEYAPEHLIIAVSGEGYFIDRIKNAGSVFMGKYTPESAGDYASGTNHVLPTNGFAKSYSGVSLDSFMKKITFQRISRDALTGIAKTIETMAEAELLEAHKNAVSIRVKKIRDDKKID